jgi:hypothetical protein
MSDYDEFDKTVDDLLQFGQSFDWITPGAAFIQSALNGESLGAGHFGIVIPPGHCLASIHQIINKAKIKSWGWTNRPDFRGMFIVKKCDVSRTNQILERNGIPVEYLPEGEK